MNLDAIRIGRVLRVNVLYLALVMRCRRQDVPTIRRQECIESKMKAPNIKVPLFGQFIVSFTIVVHQSSWKNDAGRDEAAWLV